MTETYHYDAENQCEAAIHTYDGTFPHTLLDMRYRAGNSTGKERDSESGLDNFGKRYFGTGGPDDKS
jgi:hypothetical protein